MTGGTPSDIKELLDIASHAALEAGAAIMEIYRQNDFKARLKSDNSLVTEADMQADSVISGILSRSGLPVLSEEGKDIPFGERDGWDRYWLVDPLDGTKEFVDHSGEFTVNIALIVHKAPAAGVILDPVNDVLYTGIVGHGAMKFTGASDAARISAGRKPGIPLPCVNNDTYGIVGSRSFMDDRTRMFIKEFRDIYPETRMIIRGSSLKLCMIAEGEADIYPRFSNIFEWDTAAGHAIVAAAGGYVVQAPDTGRPLMYNKQNPCNPWFIAFRDRELLNTVSRLIPGDRPAG